MPGLPDLQAQVAALTANQADMEASLALLSDNLEAVATAAGNGASVPELIDLTTTAVAGVNALIQSLTAWSDDLVSRTYVGDTLPPPIP